MSIDPPETLFGRSRVLGGEEARSLAAFLSIAWAGQFGRPPAALDSDLAQLERFFSPTSTGRRLREIVAEIPRLNATRPALLSSEIFLTSGNAKGLVTPEGRVILHLLEECRGRDSVVFNTAEVAWACCLIADLYRSWGRNRLLEVLGVTEGALRLPVIAFSLLLLINGSVGEERALPIPADEESEQALSGVIGPVVDAFVAVLRPTRKRNESFRLRGGWVLTETSRHLFEDVAFTSRSIWVRRGRGKALVGRLARELARDQKRASAEVEKAYDTFVGAYSLARPALASRGVAYERSVETRANREQLLAYFDKAQAAYTEQ